MGNRKSPFVKGDLEGFLSAQHDFDETLPHGDWNLIGTNTSQKKPDCPTAIRDFIAKIFVSASGARLSTQKSSEPRLPSP
jgi:hypothetical protein